MKLSKQERQFLQAQKNKIAELVAKQSKIFTDTLEELNFSEESDESAFLSDFLFLEEVSLVEFQKSLDRVASKALNTQKSIDNPFKQ